MIKYITYITTTIGPMICDCNWELDQRTSQVLFSFS